MDPSFYVPFVIAVGVLSTMLLGVLVLVRVAYVKVEQGTALIVNDLSATPKVWFTSGMVLPVLYKAELMPMRLVTLRVHRRGTEGIICRDGRRADIAAAFCLRVNETPADVLRVARAMGASRASDREAVDEVFGPRFSEALVTAARRFDFAELSEKREAFRDEIATIIGTDLNGYVLEDVAIHHLDQQPQPLLESNDIPSR